jgi:hypothetical protein
MALLVIEAGGPKWVLCHGFPNGAEANGDVFMAKRSSPNVLSRFVGLDELV